MRIFTGSECVKWFMKNMVGVTSMQVAQVRTIIEWIKSIIINVDGPYVPNGTLL